MAQGQAEQAVPILQRLLDEPSARGRLPLQIHENALLALAWRGRGQFARACAVLGNVLGLAEPEGYSRVLLDLGRPLVNLLREGLADHAWPEPRLSAFAGKLVMLAQRTDAGIGPAARQAPTTDSAEPLSPREVEVLRLAAQGLSNQEIAGAPLLGLSTVKTHMHNIHGELWRG